MIADWSSSGIDDPPNLLLRSPAEIHGSELRSEFVIWVPSKLEVGR
jgi:hypothetical protein